ncbi:VolA/Pla-1 family phospholipase [Bowmanella yangjiangensis]|uniref:Lipase n=1 Tax=Bowmanella yangjiangensis TaxID=2811230 RepID=A0ABS3CWQ1_9ALTE|nr:VolA/Pla-1 family phospholipase [Bowmanella yangjiangensis]MBN7821554.1 lipase [Bowmanella yangjiangensis]
MKKLVISAAVASVMGLSGCGGGESLSDIQSDADKAPAKPFARIVFDPAASKLNVPNDLLMIPDTSLGFFDFTINTASDADFNPADPQSALTALDGWSTQHPFKIDINVPSGVSLDTSSVSANSIRLFESTQALEGDEPLCQAIAAEVAAPGLPCVLGDELVWGVDYIAQMPAGQTGSVQSVQVIPLKPLKPGQGYMLVVTDDLKDSDGRPVKGSSSWELASQDPNTAPLGSDAQKQLQNILNFFMTLLGGEGLERGDVSYAAYFSTQSAGKVLSTVKSMQIAQFAQAVGAGMTPQAAAAQYLPVIQIGSAQAPDVYSALAPRALGEQMWAQVTALGLNTCSGLVAGLQNANPQIAGTATQVFSQLGMYCAAQMRQGSMQLDYYLSKTHPTTDWWRAACTNGAMLKSMGAAAIGNVVAAGLTGPYNEQCQALSQGQLFDLDLKTAGVIAFDDPRHLTKVSPIPRTNGKETLTVQVTVPDPNYANIINAQLGQPAISKPAAGWPVVILQHGITSKKEDMLAATGALSLAGYATVAIDHPLHGSRGFVIDGKVVNASSGTGGSPTDYLNLTSLLSARDNMRQSIADILGLRLGLNADVDLSNGSTTLLDGTQVSFVGHSLGAITGTGAVALANTSFGEPLAAFDGMYKIEAATLANPGGGVGGFLMESASFSPLIKGSLMAKASPEFQAALQQYMQANGIPSVTPELLTAFYPLFESQLTAEQLASANATFASFTFAAQTLIDAGDPNNYAMALAASTPVHMIEVVGGNQVNGEVSKPDQVIPNKTTLPLAGTEPLAKLMGLWPAVVSDTQGSGLVQFAEGSHSSLLDPGPSVAATTEMQKQLATFMASKGMLINITDTSVIAQ